MKVLEVCYLHGHGFQAHFRDEAAAQEVYDRVMAGLNERPENPELEVSIFFEADDMKGVIVLRDLAFINLVDIEINAITQEETQSYYDVPQTRH